MDESLYMTALERKLVHHCTPTLAGLKPANLFTYRYDTPALPNRPKSHGNEAFRRASFETIVRNHGAHKGCGVRSTVRLCREVGSLGAGRMSGMEGSSHSEGFSEKESIAEEDSRYKEGFSKALHACRRKLHPHNVCVEVLARRTFGALLYVYRDELVKRSIEQERAAAYLSDKGYDVGSLSSCIKLLHQRICGTDIESQLRGRCSFPHEIGFFLGYPCEDVIGFIENEGRNSLCSGCWKVYGQEHVAQKRFCMYKRCTALYEDLFDGGVPLEQLASAQECMVAPRIAHMSN